MDERVEEEEDTDEGFIRCALQRLKECRDAQSQWRKDAREDYAFVAGDQWDEADVQKLRDQNRPVITFNRVAPMIETVGGLEISNRQEVRYIPRTQGDGMVNELLTGAAKYYRDQCDAEDEESEAFMDTSICGVGVTETRMDYDEDQAGTIRIERIDPFEMYWDPAANKANLSDARYIFRVKALSEDEFEEAFPDAPDDIATSDFSFDNPDLVKDNPRDQYRTGDQQVEKSEFWVIEYQWREKVAVFMGPNGPVEMPMDRAEKIEKTGAQRAATKMTTMRAFICGDTVLQKGQAPCPYGFTYKFITAKRDRNDNSWYGIVRAMKDPQKWANKWLSQSLHILNSNAKGGAFIERGALQNPRKAEEQWADPSSLTLLNDGGLAKVKEKTFNQFPSGFDRLMHFAIDSMPQVTGISFELMGLADRQQAGIVENARKQAGFTIVARLFNSLRRYRKEQGRLLMHFINEYIPEGTLVRIGDPSMAQYVPLLKDKRVLQYDVIVDDAPYSPNQKDAIWAAFQQILPAIAKLPIPPQVWAEVVKNSPLPASTAEKIAQVLAQPMPDPEAAAREHEAKMKEMDFQLQSAVKQADLAIKQIDRTMKEYDLKIKTVEAQSKLGEMHMASMGETEANIANTMADTARMHAETRKIDTETALMPAELAQKAEAANRKATVQ